MPDIDHTHDALLGGLIRLKQPRKGQRASADAVMLAAAIGCRAGARVLELGCGSGVAMLCLAARLKAITVAGIELQPDLAALCARNIEANGLGERLSVYEGDIRARRIAGLAPNSFDQVFANPPYFDMARHRVSPHAGRAAARAEAEDADLGHWIAAMLRYARPNAGLTLIHKAERLGDILAALDRKAGAIRVIPLWSKAGQPAKRVIVRAIKGSKTPLTLTPGLLLHRPDGSYLPEIEAVLRDGAALPAV
ncbi:MAG: methyltransferase domain-containing protein [Ferrovibrio sp.]|uniref:tRNA1(Val) (adenine(37)-N6)-methyltransferase n=1 Tax=Ferrovibrio sp. TaxID=1917215 RepID=UPI00260636B0|nr:methyltransferase domain-containing protein [Ferrovibrio sp.]MCW0235662.1 methyltransferase domain-containing protein [Ferrovibrio sp.]